MNCTVNTVANDVNYCAESIVIEGWEWNGVVILSDAATGRKQEVTTTVDGGNTSVGVKGLMEPGHVFILATPDGTPILFDGEPVNRIYIKAVKIFSGDTIQCAGPVTLTPIK